MKAIRILTILTLAAGSVTFVTPSGATTVPGRGAAASECYVTLDVQSLPDAGVQNGNKITCTEGTACDTDGQCNGQCTFKVRTCVNTPGISGCTPPASLDKLGGNAPGKPSSLEGSACGSFTDFVVRLGGKGKQRGKKPGKKAVTAVAKAPAGTSPRADNDTPKGRSGFKFTCLPPPTTPCETGGTSCFDDAGQCANPAGGPTALTVTVLDNGTDLDNGWTGTSHNFPVTSQSTLNYCLCDCDGTTDTECKAQGKTGAGTNNSPTFGPPLPLIAGGVPVCVVNRFAGSQLSGSINLQDGTMTGPVDLLSDVYVTDATLVCPRCENGTCDSGANRGRACTVDGQVPVVNSLASNKLFKLSKTCVPSGNPQSTLTIGLPLTTGTVTTPGTGGSKPCREKESIGVPAIDDNCSSQGCGAACQAGSNACKTQGPDPTNPSQQVCIDAKGGISQLCCKNDPTRPCFATRAGGEGINRTGRAVQPTPALPDQTYPKSSTGQVLVGTFCEAGTGASTVDTVTGLPGPGAVIFNTRIDITK